MTLRRLAIIPLLVVAAAAVWFWYGRGQEETVAVPARGTAVEIVYATGSVEHRHHGRVPHIDQLAQDQKHLLARLGIERAGRLTHDLELAGRMDRRVQIMDGAIIADERVRVNVPAA